MDRQRRAGLLFVLPAVIYFGGVFLVPLLESVIGSFYRTVPGGATQFVGTRLYVKVLTDPTFWQAVGNTVSLLVMSVPVTVVLALAVALGLHRLRSLKARSAWAAMYFLPFSVSLVAAALVWQWIYDPVYGVLNHFLGALSLPPLKWLQSLDLVRPSLALVNVWARLGFDTIIFLAALQAIPAEYYEPAPSALCFPSSGWRSRRSRRCRRSSGCRSRSSPAAGATSTTTARSSSASPSAASCSTAPSSPRSPRSRAPSCHRWPVTASRSFASPATACSSLPSLAS